MPKFMKFDANEKGFDYFIGDIHGELEKLKHALKAIGFDEKNDRLFSVGDLVDRGPSSMETLLFYRDNDWFHAVQGNHETMMCLTIEGKWPLRNYKLNGGGWIEDVKKDEDVEEARKIASNMPLMIQVGNVGVVHAQPVDDWNYMIQNTSDKYMNDYVQWGREVITKNVPVFCKNIDRVFCGHTPVSAPVILGNVFFIDTGAVYGKHLTICNSAGTVVFPLED